MSVADAKVAALWAAPDAHPIALDTVLVRRYGAKWLEWETETLVSVIWDDFRVRISHVLLDQVQACKALHLVDTYWLAWEVFGCCTMAMNARAVDFEHMQVPTVAQVLVSLDSAARIRSDVPFSEEVKLYITEVHRHDGIALALPPATVIELAPGDFGLSPSQADMLRLAWSARKTESSDPHVQEQLSRLHAVSNYLEESRTRLHEQLRQVGDAG